MTSVPDVISGQHPLTVPATDRAEPPPAELVGVAKRYGPVVALQDLDLTLKPGQLTALLGPNGAGKTTAVKLLLGLTRPSRGRVRVFGHDPGSPAARQRVGVMLQVAKVPETMRVREHLHLFSSYYPDPRPLAEVLAVAGLERLAEKPFGKLSGGERQRVLFALALIGQPDLLFLDEPTVGLDVEARRGFWAQIRRLIEEGRSVLLTTHHLEEADALADRVVVLHRGTVIADGTPSEVKRLSSGKRVRCRTRLVPEALDGLPGVREVRRDKAWVEILTTQAEAVVRELLARDPELGDLEVTNVGLEEAFLALTGSSLAGERRTA